MSGPSHRPNQNLTCAQCCERLPPYLDDGLDKPESMQVFLHVRACPECAAALARQEQLIERLQSLPRRQPPPDFDTKILASVPYEAYQAMAHLRRRRVPVLLDSETLPAWARSGALRWTGATLAAVALAGRMTELLPEIAVLAVVVGLLPETILRLQALGRRLVLGQGQTQKGG